MNVELNSKLWNLEVTSQICGYANILATIKVFTALVWSGAQHTMNHIKMQAHNLKMKNLMHPIPQICDHANNLQWPIGPF